MVLHEQGQVTIYVICRQLVDWLIAWVIMVMIAREIRARLKVVRLAERWADQMTYSARNAAGAQITVGGFP